MAVEVTKDGFIKRITHKNNLQSTDVPVIPLVGIMIPGLINSHSHAFQILLRGKADNPENFHVWVQRYLYPLIEQLSTSDIHYASMVAYAQMLRNGITTVGEFHYIHNQTGIKEPASQQKDEISRCVIQAAQNVGIRIRFLYSGYDLGQSRAQKRFHRTVAEVVESLTNLRLYYLDDQLVHIGASPHSLHGASFQMIDAMIKWARENKEPAHIHLAEQKSDRKFSLDKYGESPVHYLAKKGLLDANLAIVHGIWVEHDELELLSNRQVKHVYCPLTNMYLGDGIAPILDYIKHKIPIAIGTDANIALNLFREICSVEWLQRVTSLEMGKILSQTQDGFAGKALFEMGTINGGKALKLPVGELEAGMYADFLILEEAELSFKQSDNTEHFLNQLISSASLIHLLRSVYVNGELVFDRFEGFKKFDFEKLLQKFNNIIVDFKDK